MALVSGAFAQGIWVAPAKEHATRNPLPADGKTRARGEALAKTNCMPCHGPTYKGNGPAAMALNPKPADWTSPRVQDETDGALFWKISTGLGAMPPWKQLPPNDRWALIRFIRSLGK